MNLPSPSEHKTASEKLPASNNSHEVIAEYGHEVDAIAFRKALIDWGSKHFRRFPWRFTNDPYQILMAEVMLHRTQARQVVPVYERFIEKYPTLLKLSQAREDEIYESLKSLGLLWRINLLHKMVEDLIGNYEGRVPCDRESLLSLPGVSDYIASAVRCFAWNQADALIDTNTVRITARLFEIQVKDSLRRNSKFKGLIQKLVDIDNCKEYNYALLDLANIVCTKNRPPDCIVCPVQAYCNYGTKVLASLSYMRKSSHD